MNLCLINYNDVQLPIYKNDTVGNIKIYINDKIWNIIDIKSNTDIEKLEFVDYFTEILNIFLG